MVDRDGARRVAAPGSVLVAAMALTIAPWTIRNAIEMDAFIPVATNASTTLWSGHNSEANGGATYASPELLARIPKGLDSTSTRWPRRGCCAGTRSTGRSGTRTRSWA